MQVKTLWRLRLWGRDERSRNNQALASPSPPALGLGALAEFNFPSANGFQSPNCYQDDSGEQNTNYLRVPRQTPALTSPACKFQSQPFKWQLCKQQKLLNYHRSQWCYSQEKCYWRRQQNGAKGGGDTDIKKFSLVIHECQARASHSLGNVTF